ncbi:DUF2345 domain-containing protein, partial [Pseudomonas syringae]|uniref:DUF2345 domain-containing protein n=1 Tax=Pseudomonas syringae TaxID=317 RepID=UPI0005166D57
VSIASGKSLLASVAQSISLFAQNAGARLFAAKGKIELQAQSDAMELTAQQKVMITSTAAGIEIAAQEGILLTSGGAYMPTQLNRNHPAWPESSVTQALTFYAGQTNAGSSSAWAGMPYKLFAGGALVKQDVMNKKGTIDVDHNPTTTEYVVELANGITYKIPVSGQYRGEESNAELANNGRHHHQEGSRRGVSKSGNKRDFRAQYASLDNSEPEKEI